MNNTKYLTQRRIRRWRRKRRMRTGRKRKEKKQNWWWKTNSKIVNMNSNITVITFKLRS